MRPFIFLMIVIISAPGYAADINETDSLKTYQLEDSIIVVANRYQLSVKAISNSIDLFSVKEVQEVASFSALQLTDFFSPNSFVLEKKVVGYGVGPNGAGNVYIRGMGGKPNTGVLVLINGRPDFMGIFGHPLPDVYGLSGIDQVEVIKGPSSVLFGSGAMGGAINLVTETASSSGARIELQGGNYNTYTQNVAVNTRLKSTRFGFNMTHQKTDGHIDSTGFNGWNLRGKVDYQLHPAWVASLEGRYVPYQFDDPSMGQDLASLGNYGKIRRGMIDASIEGFTGRLRNSFHVYSNLGHHRFNDGFESHDYAYGISSYQHLNYSKKIQTSFGLDAMWYGGKARNTAYPQAPPQPDAHTIRSLGIYAVGYYQPSVYLALQGGLRYQHTSQDIQKVTPTLGLSLLPVEWVKLYANYNQGFRLPTLQELYLFPVSNPDLQVEEVNSYEIGSFLYFHNKDYLKIVFFYNDIENIIQEIANPDPPPARIYRNSAQAQQHGWEGSIQFEPVNSFTMSASYSYLDPSFLTAFNPEHMLKYFFKYQQALTSMTLFGKYITNFYAGNNQIDPLGDYHLMNIALSLNYDEVSFKIQIRNLLNRQYQVLPGYQAPELNFLAGITLHWIYR